MNIKVSVRIITYNQQDWIENCLNSVLKQETAFQYNIIIFDDHSTDNTYPLLCDLIKNKKQPIKLTHNDTNLGTFENSKRALLACDGKYVAFLEGDDFWHNPHKLQMQVDFMESHHDYAMVHSDCNIFYSNSKKTIYAVNKKKKIPQGYVFEELLNNNFLKTCSTLVRRDVLLKYDDYDFYKEQKFKMADYPRWLKIARHEKIGYISDSLATYCVQENTASRPAVLSKKIDFIQSIYQVKSYFMNLYGCIPQTKKNIEESYYKRLLILAYQNQDFLLAKKNYKKLVKLKNIGIINRLKYMLYYFTTFFRSKIAL